MSPHARNKAVYARTTQAIVFADVCQSTQLFERYGNVRALRLVSRALDLFGTTTRRHGGAVVKTLGDAVMATFAEVSAAVDAASAMHRTVKEEALLAEVAMCIRIGLHTGEVIVEEGDVFGDAVNVAARMLGLARADQTITTRATARLLPPALQHHVRSLGEVRVRGKHRPIEICEVMWQLDEGARTRVAATPWSALQKDVPSMMLEYEAEVFTVQAGSPPFRMGRRAGNDLVVQGPNVSRLHAVIEFRKGHFVLIDRSTNGTYLRRAADALFLHRDESRLLREGAISLGEALTSPASRAIHYRCER